MKLSLSTLILFLGFLGFARAESASFREAKNIDAFFSVLQELDMNYVDTIDYDRLIPAAISEMLDLLDPYTVLITEDEQEDFDMSTTGNYGGVGALIHKRDSLIEVVEAYEGNPAASAGIAAGDLILAIDNVMVNRKNVDDVSLLLKGAAGSQLSLKVRKLRSGDTLSFTLTRAKVHLPSVPYFGMLNDNVGYLYFSTFTKDCAEEVKTAVIQLKKQGATRIVLDMRGNPGGLLDEAVKIANIFLPKGQEIARVRGRMGTEIIYETESRPVDTEIPLVVLINGNSASSAEVLAGALQDLDRAVIVGRRSYGKGVVQSVRPLPFNQKLKITTARYYTPSGRCVQAVDYAHRTASGGASKIADSLINRFSTRAGRVVYDGSGIAPDEELAQTSVSQVAQRLYEKNLFFEYASHFYVRHDSIAPPLAFKLNDDDYQDFIDFVEASGFNYETATSKALQQLVGLAKKERYYDELLAELQLLSDKVKPNTEKDLRRLREELSGLLEEEIVSRYHHRFGRMAVNAARDIEVQRAAAIARDAGVYWGFLQKKE